MATINYKGMKLQSITECKVFEEPREMLVWNTSYNGPIEKMVCAIIPYRHEGSVITRGGAFEYCAEIPKKPEPRRATNRELAKWLAQGNGEFTEGIEVSGKGPFTKTTSYYDASLSNNAVNDEVKVRKWDDTEWHNPTVDYLGIEDKEAAPVKKVTGYSTKQQPPSRAKEIQGGEVMHVEFLRKKKGFWFLCAYRIRRYMWGTTDWNTGIHLVNLGHSTDLRIHLFGFGISIGYEWTKEAK